MKFQILPAVADGAFAAWVARTLGKNVFRPNRHQEPHVFVGPNVTAREVYDKLNKNNFEVRILG